MNGGELLAERLGAAGVREVYGVPAGKLSPFMAAIAAAPERLRWTGVRHESAAAWMAAATFQATGRLAVCAGESGPGSHNLIGGLGSALNNSIPLIAIVSGVPTHLSYPAGLTMETDNDSLFGGATKWRATVRDIATLPDLVAQAVREARSGRPGPVAISMPPDVLAAPAGAEHAGAIAPPAPRAPNGGALERAAALLAGAERPLVIGGGGAAGAATEFRGVVGRLGAAASATQMGLGLVATDSPWFFGHGGLVGGEALVRACREADVVLAVGTRVTSWWWDGNTPLIAAGPGRRLIRIDTDANVLAGADVAVEADARAALAALLELLPRRERGPWLESLRAEYVEYLSRLRSLERAADGRMHPAALARELGAALPEGALAVYDGGHTSFWSNDLTPALEPRTRFHEPGMAHLGFGLPYALALKQLQPQAAVVNITGDGAFGFTLPELDTARRNDLAAVTVIHNNESWGVIGLGQRLHDFELGTGLEGTDYAAIARAFGCHGERIERPEEVAPALERALSCGLPAVIDARVGFEPHPGMRRFAAAGTR